MALVAPTPSARQVGEVGALVAIGLVALLAWSRYHHALLEMREVRERLRVLRDGGLDLPQPLSSTGDPEVARALDKVVRTFKDAIGEIRTERDLLERILRGMQEGVLVLDANDRVVLVNPALRSMLMLTSHVERQPILEIVRHADLHELLHRGKESSAPISHEIEMGGLRPRRLLAQVSRLEGEGGGMVAVFVDMTELRRLESLRKDFVANVSHELRTPVASVLSATETLETGGLRDPAAAAKFLAIIRRNAERLESLIEDLLELSRIESRQFRLRKGTADLVSTLSLVRSTFRDRAEKKNIHLELLVPEHPVWIETDQRAIEQIVGNLVDNAIKYCPAASRVTIALRDNAGQLAVSVEDTGPGIEEKYLPRIFERFYRIDKGRSRDQGGTGLGLSIVKHLAEALGGDVSVESTVGKGSRFSVRLRALPAVVADADSVP